MSRADRRRQKKLAQKQGRPPTADPKLDQAMAQAMQLHGQGNLSAAEGLYRQILHAQPDHVGALHLLGVLALQAGHPGDAVKLLERAVGLPGVNPAAFVDLGNAYAAAGRTDDAIAMMTRAAELVPTAQNHINLGKLFLEAKRERSAFDAYDRAAALDPNNAEAVFMSGTLLLWRDDTPGALARFDKAVELQPDNADFHLNRGVARQELGQLEDARASFRRALTLRPGFAKAYDNLSAIEKWSGDEDEIRDMRQAFDAAATDEDKMLLAFALGKASETFGAHDEAFAFFARANALKRAAFTYDVETDRRHLETLKSVFTPAFLERHAQAGVRDGTPVFIVGMPRSGTTLVEQVLAAHPDVYGAGELYDLGHTLTTTFGDVRAPDFADTLASCSDETLNEAGALYLRAVRRFDADARRITDKMPSNFQYLGLIKAILPDAKVIHCVRDPMDTCLSIFRTNFSDDGLPYAYDLEDLGAYYALYLDMMDHWKAVLPGFVYEVRYEDVVADLKGQAEGLLAFCGLDWNDACLEFHAAQRQVKTASASQVRQPIYTSSVAAWKKYERQLQPFKAALDSRAG